MTTVAFMTHQHIREVPHGNSGLSALVPHSDVVLNPPFIVPNFLNQNITFKCQKHISWDISIRHMTRNVIPISPFLPSLNYVYLVRLIQIWNSVLLFLTRPSDLLIGPEILLSYTLKIFLSLSKYISGFNLLLGCLLNFPWPWSLLLSC